MKDYTTRRVIGEKLINSKSKNSIINRSSTLLSKKWKSYNNYQGKSSYFHVYYRAIKASESYDIF